MKKIEHHSPAEPTILLKTLIYDCRLMLHYALASGLQITPNIADTMAKTEKIFLNAMPDQDIRTPDEEGSAQDLSATQSFLSNHTLFSELVSAYNELSRIVSPATPRSLAVTEGIAAGVHGTFNTIPLLNRLMLAAISCLFIFILTGASKYVGVQGGGDIATSSGFPFLYNQINFLAAAGLGSSFYALFTVNRFVVERTYDPVFQSTYWIRFTLGLISGTILANFIKIDINPQVSDAMEKATVAMLGGFSAEAVYRILNRMVAAVITLVRGDTKDISKGREAIAKTNLSALMEKQRMELATELLSLHSTLKSGADTSTTEQELNKIISGLTGKTVVPQQVSEENPIR